MIGYRKDKDRRDNNTLNTPYPPYSSSAKYSHDPFYSSEASDDSEKLQEEKMGEEQDDKVMDEPVESWGWVQNTD